LIHRKRHQRDCDIDPFRRDGSQFQRSRESSASTEPTIDTISREYEDDSLYEVDDTQGSPELQDMRIGDREDSKKEFSSLSPPGNYHRGGHKAAHYNRQEPRRPKTGFTEPQIKELKFYRRFVLICDGYDEGQQTHNLQSWFRSQSTKSKTTSINTYLCINLSGMQRNTRRLLNSSQPGRTSQEPLLDVAVIGGATACGRLGQHFSASRITRVALYDQFVEIWLERGKKQLSEKELSSQAKAAFESLSDEGFTQNGIDFLKKLSVAIYKEQGGQPVVQYSRYKDEGSWKSTYFSREEEKQLLREACSLVRSSNQHRFTHRSLLEYGLALAIFGPQDWKERAVLESTSARRGSMSFVLSFRLQGATHDVTTNTDQGLDPNSPLSGEIL
ncbi:hypothetical protein BGX34_007128, partial [Mortierella sp. NVP85]